MKNKLTLLLLTFLTPLLTVAQEAIEKGIDEKIDESFGAATGWFVNFIFYTIKIGDHVAIPWVLFPLIAGAIYFTVYFKFINFKGFKTAIGIVRGNYDDLEDHGEHVKSEANLHLIEGDNPDTIRIEGEHGEGEVSHFQALTAALSATVGLGNIAGVAIALSIGGPGATFWMILAGFLGMASKFTECTLGVKYREIDSNGVVYGGPMYYLKKGLAARGLLKMGKVLAIAFAIMCIGGSFGGGNMFQVNQAYSLVESMSKGDIKEADISGLADKYVEVDPGYLGQRYIEEYGSVYSVSNIANDSVFLSNGNFSLAYSDKEIRKNKKLGFLKGVAKDQELEVPSEILSPFYFGTSGGNDFTVLAQSTDGNVMISNIRSEKEMQLTSADLMSSAKKNPLHGYGWLFGLIMSIFVGVVIIGGIKSIAKVTDKIVPFMVLIYVTASIVVIIAKYDLIGDAFAQIWNGAFSPIGIAGGFVGVLVQGFKRAAFSNEAGIGSASIAHSAVKTKHPASEGMVALLEPFIDTVLVCTMTALVLIITGTLGTASQGMNDAEAVLLTSRAFGSVMSWFPWVLMIAVILFAFSTMISWSYYGFQAWSFLFGRTRKMEITYKVLFCVFVIIGAAANLGSVIGFSDAMIFAMMVPNMIGLVILAPRVKEELNKYLKAIKVRKA